MRRIAPAGPANTSTESTIPLSGTELRGASGRRCCTCGGYASQQQQIAGTALLARDRTNRRVGAASVAADIERIANRIKSKVRSRVTANTVDQVAATPSSAVPTALAVVPLVASSLMLAMRTRCERNYVRWIAPRNHGGGFSVGR